MQWAGRKLLRPVDVVDEDPRGLLPPKAAAMALTIAGHAREAEGKPGEALQYYQAAAAADPGNADIKCDLTRQLRPYHALAPVFGSRGLALARKGNWAAAQAMFVRARAHAGHSDERQGWDDYLRAAIRDEIARRPPIEPGQIGDQSQPDPRLSLQKPLQAAIWAARARMLEAMARRSEAVDAYDRAYKLSPEVEDYKTQADRIRREMAERRPRPLPDVHPGGLMMAPRFFQYSEIALAPQPELSQARR